ncbi:uncharacterized protein LOC119662942 isoform X1 [Teleopsis dalmanni]|uniref:uncharacterized protein LOC119662942 isoform X1 n=1 Tax=Teleopsis dalmanni TaxID=139649 RepID=UPI0018CDFA80|nr:uncharacterized protein LOC119662942 isoform X1 [Teleopsis dalmanni]
MSKMRILRNIYIAVQPQFLYVVIITFVGAFTINYRVAASPVEIVLNTTNHGITINASPNWNPLPNAQYSNKTQNNNILTDLKISETIPSILAPQQTPMSINTLPTVYYGHKKRDRLLKCHCDICKETNFICETDGYCFTSVEKGSDATTFSYRCLNLTQSFPPGRFIWCNDGTNGGPTARPAAVRGGHACCKERDLCNLKLRPKIKLHPIDLERNKEGARNPQKHFVDRIV